MLPERKVVRVICKTSFVAYIEYNVREDNHMELVESLGLSSYSLKPSAVDTFLISLKALEPKYFIVFKSKIILMLLKWNE